VVHSWEFCDESDEHQFIQQYEVISLAEQLVISTSNLLQPVATAVYCITLLFPHSFWCHSQINNNTLSFENFTAGFVKMIVFWDITV